MVKKHHNMIFMLELRTLPWMVDRSEQHKVREAEIKKVQHT